MGLSEEEIKAKEEELEELLRAPSRLQDAINQFIYNELESEESTYESKQRS